MWITGSARFLIGASRVLSRARARQQIAAATAEAIVAIADLRCHYAVYDLLLHVEHVTEIVGREISSVTRDRAGVREGCSARSKALRK